MLNNLPMYSLSRIYTLSKIKESHFPCKYFSHSCIQYNTQASIASSQVKMKSNFLKNEKQFIAFNI